MPVLAETPMAPVPEIVEIIAAYSGATGLDVAPGVKKALEAFFRSDAKRNLIASVSKRLLEERPPPGDQASMDEISRQLSLQLVDPDFLAAMEDLAHEGR